MKKEKAFTLIELIVVLVILAIIALIVTPIILNILDKAEVSARKRSVDGYGKAAELALATYRMEKGYYPKAFDELSIEYSGSNIKCNEQIINKDGSIYLSKCYVDKVKVKDSKTDNGYYQYGKIVFDYKIGDIVTYNNIKFYVISNSNTSIDYVTLLKAEPLTVDEVNTYGKDHINRYTSSSVGTAYNSNGYGGMAYYSSETCNSANNSWVTTGCTTDYSQSEVKYVVDAWTADKFKASDLSVDTTGYSARLITFDELTDNLGYNGNPLVGGCVGQYYAKSESTPEWVHNNNYWYWTMSVHDDSKYQVWNVTMVGEIAGSSVLYYPGSIRPVINLKKSVIE